MATPEYWRVGFRGDPLGFPPVEIRPKDPSKRGRFDDPQDQFSTLYVAESPVTAWREVLARHRPNAKERERFKRLFPNRVPSLALRGRVTAGWMKDRKFVGARLELSNPLLDLCEPEVRQEIEDQYSDLLAGLELEYFDIPELTTRQRQFTQRLAARLWKDGIPGVRFHSSRDGDPCVALFEERGEALPDGDEALLRTIGPQSYEQVCSEWRLDGLSGLAQLTKIR